MWGKMRHSVIAAPLKWAFLMARQWHSRWMDRRWNIDTAYATGKKWALGGHFADDHIYEPVPYLLLPAFAQPLQVTARDVVFDIGCGSGRWLFFFAQLGVKECVGVELSEQLVAKGRENIKRFQERKRVEGEGGEGGGGGGVRIEYGDAAQADYGTGTIFVLFNPFGPQTMKVVLDRIGLSLEQHPRRIQLLYINPKHEEIFQGTGWLRKMAHVHPRFTSTQASVWSNGVGAERTDTKAMGKGGRLVEVKG